eukprot:3520847-Rhodomonas_salina.2
MSRATPHTGCPSCAFCSSPESSSSAVVMCILERLNGRRLRLLAGGKAVGEAEGEAEGGKACEC